MRVALAGEGPLIVLCHGFPESWRSWRSQIEALAGAGFRAAAPDMRGYGGTDAPESPDQYTMVHHAGDMVGLAAALGEREAVIVGHDWGAPVAWNSALLRPDIFRAVVGMSVPYIPPSKVDLLTALEANGVRTFYMQYFQTPGVAEAEFSRDVADSLRRTIYSLSGDAPPRTVAGVLAPGAGFLDATVEPPSPPPAWWNADDLEADAEELRRKGFAGPLNWYRAIRKSSELLAPWRGAPIRQPSLFIAGERDDVLKFPGMKARLDGLGAVLPGLRGSHVLPGAGHWIQRERADEVNALLLAFLRGL
ncbi:MAG: alpha/beta hydrolase [Hyphomicrobiales bacterium]|nr:alpha/beta hydrolase [Hyphomicrobiales bacterium]